MSVPVLLAVTLTAVTLANAVSLGPQDPQRPGYTDTAPLPGQRWRVHDAARPYPPVVAPGAPCTDPAASPADATVLFGGSDLTAWKGRDGDARWKVADGCMEVNGTGDIETREAFGDCQLHIEWATPREVHGDSQDRGNSGVFLMGRYEIQVLDSFENPTYADGQAAALYGQHPPLVNACRAPGEWQTYDIVFVAPRFEDGELAQPGRVTVLHNGIVVHHDREILGATAHRAVARYRPHEPTGPIKLQDHGSAVRYRNIWVRPLGGEGR